MHFQIEAVSKIINNVIKNKSFALYPNLPDNIEQYIVDRNIQYFPYYLTKLVSKKNIGPKNVYDITIDNTHNFVANGIVVHNCHGLPIEYEIEKKLGIKTKEEILNFGIGNYNEECRSIVLKYRGEWKKKMERLGRCVEEENN